MKIYILGSILIAVMCVTKHCVYCSLYRYINVYVLGKVYIAMKCVIEQSVTQVA